MNLPLSSCLRFCFEFLPLIDNLTGTHIFSGRFYLDSHMSCTAFGSGAVGPNITLGWDVNYQL